MQTVAFIVVAASGLWLIAVSALMAIRPRHSLQLLDLMVSNLSASNWRLVLTEQGLRLLAGLGLIVRSPSSKLPWLFEVGGWFIVASALLIIALPMRWHAAYGLWWSRRLTPQIVRALAPVSAAMGCVLIYLAS